MNTDPGAFLLALRRPVPLVLVSFDRVTRVGRRVLWAPGDPLPYAVGRTVAYAAGIPGPVPDGWTPEPTQSGAPRLWGSRGADVAWCSCLWAEGNGDDPTQVLTTLAPATLQVDIGGKSIHHYWVFDRLLPVAEWQIWANRLLAHLQTHHPSLGIDPVRMRPGICMQLPGTLHPKTGQVCTWANYGPVYADPADLGIDATLPPVPRGGAHGPAAAPPGGTGPGWLSRADDGVLTAMLRAIGPLGPVGSATDSVERWSALMALVSLTGPARAASVAAAAGWDAGRVARLLAERERRGYAVGPGTLPVLARAAGWRWSR